MAISGRRRLDPSSRLKALNCPPASRTVTLSGANPISLPFSRALSTIIEAMAKVSDCIGTPSSQIVILRHHNIHGLLIVKGETISQIPISKKELLSQSVIAST
jgi:hypothetical protein